MKRHLLNLIVLSLLTISLAFAQNKTIKGKVTGADDGLPMPTVSVKVPGTTIGVQTDLNGNYSISVPATATTLEFSSIGHQLSSEAISGRTTINIGLKPDP